MIYLGVILVYLFALIAIGVVKSRKIHTQSDFALAGRALTPWVLVGTMLATWIGTGSILGNAGKTYETGMAALMLPIGSILGIILLTRIAGKVRSYEKYTVPEIIGERYGSVARLLSVIALVLAYMVIVHLFHYLLEILDSYLFHSHFLRMQRKAYGCELLHILEFFEKLKF
jgi:Na+/proline symporter